MDRNDRSEQLRTNRIQTREDELKPRIMRLGHNVQGFRLAPEFLQASATVAMVVT